MFSDECLLCNLGLTDLLGVPEERKYAIVGEVLLTFFLFAVGSDYLLLDIRRNDFVMAERH